MHFLGPNLELNRTFRAINGRMDGLVTVSLAVGNIVLETTRHGFPKLMDIAQHGIDITVSAQNATNGNQIVDLIKPFLLVLHFAVDGVNMLGTTINLPM